MKVGCRYQLASGGKVTFYRVSSQAALYLQDRFNWTRTGWFLVWFGCKGRILIP